MTYSEILRVFKHIFVVIVYAIFLNDFSFAQSNPSSDDLLRPINDSVLILNNKILINTNSRTLTVPAKIHKVEGPIEVVLFTNKGKAYESLLTTDVSPLELQTSLLLLGYKSLENKVTKKNKKQKFTKADSLYLFVEWLDSNKIYNCSRVENFIWNMQTHAVLNPISWVFNGLLTDLSGKIVSNDEISMIVTNYDYTSILSINKNLVFNTSISGIHTNLIGEDSYSAFADRGLAEKNINLIFKSASKKSKCKGKRKN